MQPAFGTMNTQPITRRLLALVVLALSTWIVHGFLEPMACACVIAIATWPLYARFRRHMPSRVGQGSAAVLFTVGITVFVLAPLVFACIALIDELRSLLIGLAAGGLQGVALPAWLSELPMIPRGFLVRGDLSQSGGLALLTRHADPAAVLGWAQSLARFTVEQVLMIGFAILLLFFFYSRGDTLARAVSEALARTLGASAQRYASVATRAIRASASSMLGVALFDVAATAIAYSLAGAPRPLVWAAITGAMAAVPFLGYAVVGALALVLAVKGLAAPALLSLSLGAAVLLCGDKVVRPIVARGGIRLPFVWVLMGCIGGFSVFGLSGLFTGPAMLAVAREVLQRSMVRQA
jgi:predicted PurR-regulated permease PerM